MSAQESPAIFEWSCQLASGIDVLDADHKTFFDMARQLHEILLCVDPEHLVVDSILSVLEEYVEGHFRREEMFLRHGPPAEFREHKRQHDGFRRKVKKAAAAWRKGEQGALVALPAMVAAWITEHIVKVDHGYFSWVSAKDVDARPLGLLVATRRPAGSPGRRSDGSS